MARAARYPAGLLENVSVERRKRFFIPDGASFVLSQDVRELCIFSPHSVIRDPPFSRIDLISCRNLLIYFGPAVQNQVIPTFYYALRPDGYLFLGSAENASQFDDLFTPVAKHHRIFRRRSDVTPSIRVPLMVSAFRPWNRGDATPRKIPTGTVLRQAVDNQVIENFAPPHVVVNRDGDVVYFSSRTGKYFEAPAGVPTRQLTSMARRGLRLDLRTVFREAVETGRTVSKESVPIEGDNGGVQFITITVSPLDDQGKGEPLYLVLFADHRPILSQTGVLHHAQSSDDGVGPRLDRELRETRDRLQSLIEEYETALEELKSSNEELVSVNEEMQSTNEELEASKEEVQSVNEELHTVNAELSGKIEALDQANSDLQNLFESTDVATIFLDKQLVIRSYTPAVAEIFNVLPGDRGRPITDLSSQLDMTSFAADVMAVCADQRIIERRVEKIDHTAHFLMRIAPYRNSDHRTEGAVVTFVDITSLVRADARQRMLIAEMQHRTRNLLGIVQSIAQQTLGKGGTLETFSTRLSALGRVQGLVGGALDDQIDLGEIVRLELAAVGAPTDGRVTIAGSPVPLGFELVQTFGLALHELATNAAKYGALKHGTGRLQIAWSVSDTTETPVLTLEWRESGVHLTSTPSGRGFGLELIKRALPFTLRAKVEHTFGPDGVSCRIELPLRPVVDPGGSETGEV